MTGVHEQLEILGRAEARRRREVAEDLIAPRARERMLHHRQQLDMREAHLLHVRHQPLGHLAIGEKAVAVLGHAHPRPEVHLVGRHRLRQPRAPCGTRGLPRLIVPAIGRGVVDDRGGLRRRLERPRERIGLLQNRAGSGANLELVFLAVRQVGDEHFPHAARREQPHRMDSAVPAVEVADHADAVGVGRPHREVDAGRRADDDPVRAELVEHSLVRAFAEQVQIEVGQHAPIAIRIVDLDHVIVRET